HPLRGRPPHGAAQPPGPQADVQAEDLRRAEPPAPGPAARGIQGTHAVVVTGRETVAEVKTKKTNYRATARRKTAGAGGRRGGGRSSAATARGGVASAGTGTATRSRARCA